MLDWSMIDLARAVRMSVSTIKRVEDGRPETVSDRVVAVIRAGLEAEGVRFLPDDGYGPGMRLPAR